MRITRGRTPHDLDRSGVVRRLSIEYPHSGTRRHYAGFESKIKATPAMGQVTDSPRADQASELAWIPAAPPGFVS